MVPNNGITARYLLLEEGRQLIASQQFLGPLALLKAAGCVVETGQHDGATQVLQDEEEENLLFFDLFWGGNMGNYTPKPTRPPEIQKKKADSSPNKGGRTKLWYLARKPPMFHPPFFGGWDVVGHATKCQRKIAISPYCCDAALNPPGESHNPTFGCWLSTENHKNLLDPSRWFRFWLDWQLLLREADLLPRQSRQGPGKKNMAGAPWRPDRKRSQWWERTTADLPPRPNDQTTSPSNWWRSPDKECSKERRGRAKLHRCWVIAWNGWESPLGEIYEVQITKNIKLIQMSYQKQNGSSHHDPPRPGYCWSPSQSCRTRDCTRWQRQRRRRKGWWPRKRPEQWWDPTNSYNWGVPKSWLGLQAHSHQWRFHPWIRFFWVWLLLQCSALTILINRY